MLPSEKRVIVVDDEDDVRMMLYELLTSEGYKVTSASNGPDALKVLARSRFDLAITDLRMPMMEGIEFVEKIKSIAPETKVIVLTAYGTHQLHLEALEKGADDMLLKPLKNAELLRTVQRLFEAPAAKGKRQPPNCKV